MARIMTSLSPSGDAPDDRSLRPQSLADYIGQDSLKKQLSVYIRAARDRSEALDHVLLYGPPGLGKTTLSHILANELGVSIKTTSGPAIEKPGDIAAILTSLRKNDVLFIDEIHRLNKVVEEVLYPAMEDYALDIIIGKGPGSRSIRLDLQPFTLVGATTRAGMVSSPLRDRFGIVSRLELYTQEELVLILERSSRILGVKADREGLEEMARRSRFTPRIANRFLKRVRDYAQVNGIEVIGRECASRALSMMEVDDNGLDRNDLALLGAVVRLFDGGPVGVETLAAAIGEEKDTIEDVYEPYLMQTGYIARTPRGRTATRRAYELLGAPYPQGRDEASGEGQP